MNKVYRERLEHIISDWPAKILSLAGAIALFFFYQLNRLEERPLSVPLIVTANEDFVPASPYPRTVRLVLRGESNIIYAVLEGDLQATLDLRSFTSAGVWRVPVQVEKRGSALGIDPLEISVDPADIAIAIEPRVVKEIQVVPSFRGFLEPGYELAGFSLVPTKIEVAGPAGLMEKLNDATTEPIELTSRASNFSIRTKIALRDPLLTILSTNSIEFQAEVQKALVYRNYQDIEVRFVGLDNALILRTTPPLGSAKVAGTSVELENLVLSPGILEVDLSGIEAPGEYTVAVVPRFPEGLDVESWLPMVATVTVERAPAGSRTEVLP